ncbi:MAG: sulfurtransferase TusA family protein [Methanomicrobiales archaeon]
MVTKNLDITGKVCPYCLLVVQKQVKVMKQPDELVIKCDHPPTATTSIPQFARDNNLNCEVSKISSGLWEIRLKKN